MSHKQSLPEEAPGAASTGKTYFLPFDPSQAIFTKQGDDLLIQTEQGEATRIEGFFTHAQGSVEFVLSDGVHLDARLIFQTFNPELVTAMNQPAQAPSSGGHYDDDPGKLIGGVDRLNALGPESAESSAAREFSVQFSSQAGNTGEALAGIPPASSDLPVPPSDATVPSDTSVLPEVPDLPVPPSDSTVPSDTSVLPEVPDLPVPPSDSTTPSDTSVLPEVPDSPEFRIVVYGSAADPGSWTPGMTFGLSGQNSAVAFVADGAHGTARLLDNGSILYIPDPGEADWPDDGGPITDSLLVTFADGSLKLVEVLVVNGTSYDAANHADLGGEQHEGLIQGVYAVSGTEHADSFTRRTGSTGLASGSVLDMGAGDDHLTVAIDAAGSAYGIAGSSVRLGDGNDRADITVSGKGGPVYGVSGGLLDMGDGNDILNIAATAAAGTNSWAYALSGGAKADLGGGDNVATVSATGAGRAYGIAGTPGGARTSLVADDGNDTLIVNVQAGANGYGMAMSYADVNLSNGDNRLELNLQGGVSASLTGLEQSKVTMGAGNDVLSITMNNTGYGVSNSTINMGEGNNRLTITGASTGLYGNVTMGSGDDALIITSTEPGSANRYGLVGYGLVSMGAGDDLVSVTLAGGSADAMSTGTLDMGAGNDKVYFQATGSTYSAGGMNDRARLLMGAGDDLLTISASAKVSGASALAYGLHNGSSVDMGDGNDVARLDVSASGASASVYAYGLAGGSSISAGKGNDELDLRVSSSAKGLSGAAEAAGVAASGLDMGAGDDILNIDVSAFGALATARGVHSLYSQNNTVDAGAGNDTITVSATATGTNSALAAGVSNAILLAGTGDDHLTVSSLAVGGNAVAMGLQQAVVNLGDGNDTVNISARSDGDAYGLTNGTNGLKVTGGSLLDLGAGDDQLVIDVHAGQNAYGIHKSTIMAGDGNDSVLITAEGAHSHGLHGAVLDLGAGDDRLEIRAETAIYDSSITLGLGDDYLNVSGTIDGHTTILAGDGRDILRLDGALTGSGLGQLVDAGADDDLIILGRNFSMQEQADIHGGTGIDTLKLESGLDVFDFSAHTGRITGLERLDLTDGAHEITLSLEDVRALTNDASGVGQGEALRILGDQDDVVRLAGDGWRVDAGTVSLADVSGVSHDYHTAVNGDTTLYIDDRIFLNMVTAA